MKGVIRWDKGKAHYFLNGKEVTKAAFDKEFPDKRIEPGEVAGGQQPSCWPMTSQGAAVHPDQIPEAMESARKKGVPTDFTPTGEPIFTGREHRKRYLHAYGYHDKDGGYGDG